MRPFLVTFVHPLLPPLANSGWPLVQLQKLMGHVYKWLFHDFLGPVTPSSVAGLFLWREVRSRVYRDFTNPSAIGPASNVMQSCPLIRSGRAISARVPPKSLSGGDNENSNNQTQTQPMRLRCFACGQFAVGWALVDTSSCPSSGSKAKHPLHHG